jgi:hypothetical protein
MYVWVYRNKMDKLKIIIINFCYKYLHAHIHRPPITNCKTFYSQKEKKINLLLKIFKEKVSYNFRGFCHLKNMHNVDVCGTVTI